MPVPPSRSPRAARAWPPALRHAPGGRVSGLCRVSETSEGGLGLREVDGAAAQSGPQALGRGDIGRLPGSSASWLFVDPTPRPPPPGPAPAAFGAVAVPSARRLRGPRRTRPRPPGWQPGGGPAGADVRPEPQSQACHCFSRTRGLTWNPGGRKAGVSPGLRLRRREARPSRTCASVRGHLPRVRKGQGWDPRRRAAVDQGLWALPGGAFSPSSDPSGARGPPSAVASSAAHRGLVRMCGGETRPRSGRASWRRCPSHRCIYSFDSY